MSYLELELPNVAGKDNTKKKDTRGRFHIFGCLRQSYPVSL
jgi:hypothetical protein